MSKNGVWQLSKLTLRYCKHGGSSSGAREFIDKNVVEAFKKENPQVEIEFVQKNGRHPTLFGEYVWGGKKQISLRNMNTEEISKRLVDLRNTWGYEPKNFTHFKHFRRTESLQGYWDASKDYSSV